MSRQRAKTDLEETAANVFHQNDGSQSAPAKPHAEALDDDIVTDVTIVSSPSEGKPQTPSVEEDRPRKKKPKRRKVKTSERAWPAIAVGSEVAFVIRLVLMAVIFLVVCIMMPNGGRYDRYVVALIVVVVFRGVLFVLEQMGVFGLSDDD